jgi:hypothetical protein
MQKNTHELKLEHFSFKAKKWNIFLRCGQQHGEMFGVVSNNAEELPQRTTVKNFLSASLYLLRNSHVVIVIPNSCQKIVEHHSTSQNFINLRCWIQPGKILKSE